MRAFLGDSSVKSQYIKQIKKQIRSGEVLRGHYPAWNGNSGTPVGCTIQCSVNTHKQFEQQLGIPESLAYLEDEIFQGLPDQRAATWPRDFLEAIPVGADLSKVWHYFAAWLIRDSGLVTQLPYSASWKSCSIVLPLHFRAATGQSPALQEWMRASRLAYNASQSYFPESILSAIRRGERVSDEEFEQALIWTSQAARAVVWSARATGYLLSKKTSHATHAARCAAFTVRAATRSAALIAGAKTARAVRKTGWFAAWEKLAEAREQLAAASQTEAWPMFLWLNASCCGVEVQAGGGWEAAQAAAEAKAWFTWQSAHVAMAEKLLDLLQWFSATPEPDSTKLE